jgi:hypothetical protein
MKVKKSRLLFAGALFFLAFGWYILDSAKEIPENAEIMPNEGSGFALIAFALCFLFGLLYARKNL